MIDPAITATLETQWRPNAAVMFPAEGFRPVVLENNWVPFTDAYDTQYYKHFQRVFVEGFIKDGTLGQAAFHLPDGFKPLQQLFFAVASNGAYGEVRLDTDGAVIPNAGSAASFSLAGVSFRV